MRRVLTVVFAIFAFNWLMFDLPVALGLGDLSGGWYAREVDPLFLEPPVWLDVVGIFAACYGPFYMAIAYGLFRDRGWLPLVALPFAGFLVATTSVYLIAEFLGDVPPTNVPLFLALNLPYIVFPIVLAVRSGARVAVRA